MFSIAGSSQVVTQEEREGVHGNEWLSYGSRDIDGIKEAFFDMLRIVDLVVFFS